MKIIVYIKETLLCIAYALAVILVTDILVLSSEALNKGAEDVIYLNVILASIGMAFWIYGYMRFRGRFMKLRLALDKSEHIDYLIPEGGDFHSVLLRDAVRLINDEKEGGIASYQENMDELNEYITKWVHEIKIPISVCEIILENAGSDCTEASENIKMELERIKFLVNQVLYAGRALHYGEDLATGEFSLDKAVKEAVKRNARFFISKNIEITLGPVNFNIVSDEKWVSYILDQILNNASKYTGYSGRVCIYADEDQKAVRLHIKDNGIGIGVQDIRRVFDKGFTGENGRRTAKSTGMGMYYSKKIADRLGIGIEVSSSVGEYTEFVVVFYKLSDYLKVTKM